MHARQAHKAQLGMYGSNQVSPTSSVCSARVLLICHLGTCATDVVLQHGRAEMQLQVNAMHLFVHIRKFWPGLPNAGVAALVVLIHFGICVADLVRSIVGWLQCNQKVG